MRKFLLTGLAVLFIGLCANAETIIHYNAGMPVSMTTTGPGYMNTVPVVRGNAASNVARYARPYATGMRPIGGMRPLPPMSYRTNRAMANGYYNNYYRQPTVVTRTTTTTEPKKVSRLNKDYVRPQRNSYTRNGVTYYN